MIDQYNEILCSLLNKHAPLRSREIILRPHAPWFSDELRELKREKRRLERKYVNTNLTVHKEMYQMICTEYTKHIEAAKTEYFRKKVEDASHDQLFKFVDKFLNVKKAPILPKHESSKELAERFSEHFQMKIAGIRRELSASSIPSLTIEDHETCLAPPLSCFQPESPSQIKRFIMSSKTKSCQLDPVPTWILKGCINQLLPTITEIINSSLEQGHFPSKLKESIVYPLLKKPALDPEDNNNFRPISNLSFLSKTLERIAAVQLDNHLTDNQLYAKMQSAYRKYHSTESALLKVFNDINTAIDNQHECVLVLLDLSAAFDTIDHKILINRLENKYGISGLALEWLKSYLQERPQRVIVNGTYSDPKYNSFGVPQGSVLGPLLFSLYYGPLEDVIRAHGIDTMMYADDCQLYIIIKRSNRRVALDQLELCIDDVLRWNTQNGLKCNPSKTEVIHFYSRYMPSDSISHLRVGTAIIEPVNEVRDLGITLDSTLTLRTHINNKCRSGSLSLHELSKIRKFLSQKDTERVVHAFISSKLDYCNGLFYGLPSSEIQKLQRLQNAAARLITRTKISDHITPVLINLHWLPIEHRVIFKLLLYTYKALHGLAPDYLANLLTFYKPVRTLRSSRSNNLSVPRSRTSTYGDRTFACVSPRLWNQLPDFIRYSETLDSFKTRLKTHLFKIAFNL